MRSWRIVLSALCVLVVGRWSPGASKDGTVLAPKDAQWTIVCKTFSGPGHAQQAKQMKELLLRTTKLRDWYLVQGEQETTLYHGFYRTFMTGAEDSKDRKEAERAQEDKKAIFLWMDPEGKQVFEHCYFVELSAPGADGPPEWNLANKDAGKPDGDPTKAYFSLEVGVYMGQPQPQAGGGGCGEGGSRHGGGSLLPPWADQEFGVCGGLAAERRQGTGIGCGQRRSRRRSPATDHRAAVPIAGGR